MKPKASPLSICALLLVLFIDAMGWGIALPVFQPLIIGNITGLMPAHASEVWRSFDYEMTIAVYCVFMFLFSPVLGSWSDKYGRKKILMMSMAGAALGFLTCYLGVIGNSLTVIFIGRIISGATAGSFPIAQAAMIDISPPEKVAARISWVAAANGIGFGVGPVVGGLFLDPKVFHTLHYDIPFLICVSAALFCMLMIYLFFKETFVGNSQQRTNPLLGVVHIYQAFAQPKLRLAFASLLFFMLGFSTFFSMMPLMISNRFLQNGAYVGYFFTYYATLFSIGLIFLLPKVTARYSLKKIVLWTILGQAVLYSFFALSGHLMWLWIWITPISILIPFSYVGIATMISKLTDAQNQGKNMGIVGSVCALSFGIGPVVAGVGNDWGILLPYVISILFQVAAFSLASRAPWSRIESQNNATA